MFWTTLQAICVWTSYFFGPHIKFVWPVHIFPHKSVSSCQRLLVKVSSVLKFNVGDGNEVLGISRILKLNQTCYLSPRLKHMVCFNLTQINWKVLACDLESATKIYNLPIEIQMTQNNISC